MAVLIGAAQNILSKAAKYSLFDPCKESAFIPLDAESRTKGKAAVEVIGGPLGKSGGSFLQQVCAWILVYYRILSVLFVHCSRVCIQFLIGVFGSLSACTPYLGVALGGIIAAWIAAASQLNTLLQDLQNKDAKDKEAIAAAANSI